MKKVLLVSLIFLFSLTACESSREIAGRDVPCVGLGDPLNPDYEYRVSVRNAVLGVIFSEMIIPLVVWLAADFYCPVGIVRKGQ